jgi:1-acyl-sn-glycerol-3-phosphate acyltransferase
MSAVRATAETLAGFVRAYFRPTVTGLEHIPEEPSMLVGNHDGGYLPVDGICLGMAWHETFGYRRPLIWLMHDFPFRLSAKLTGYLSRCGVRPANRDSLRYAFDNRHSLFVYPGGSHEAFRPFTQRRHIELGHRTGFVAEALKHRVPISPVVSVGAHETLFVVARGSGAARLIEPIMRKFRADVLPVWLGMPWGVGFGPLPHLPLPSKIGVEVQPPIRLWKELGETADPQDPLVLKAGLDLVRRRMQSASDRLYSERRFPIIG